MTTTVDTAALERHIAIETDADMLTVRVTYTAPGLDRTDGAAWGLKLTHRALAERLVRAIEAGVILSEPQIRTDIHGRTYVSVSSSILARMMNAELRRLGY